MHTLHTHDLFIAGGGINGVGIAADASGRGLVVGLAEMGDLASATSSASSKLIHGGLRYLEHFEVRLVREALAEREVLLKKAPHIIWPLRFVLPYIKGLRPRWMIRTGLFLYDHLYRRAIIPASHGINLARDRAGRSLRPELNYGFCYWDCWVDDARLVVLNARAAADRGAEILTRTRVIELHSDGEMWRVVLESSSGRREIRARAFVNAAGPWADKIDLLAAAEANHRAKKSAVAHLRLVKGSHIVVPRVADTNDAYLLQSPDKRVVFALPFEEHFTIIGTTDVPYAGDPANATIDGEEKAYLLELAQQFFRAPLEDKDIIWSYAGVRPLYDDLSAEPSAVTRDYHLELLAGPSAAPRISVYGGKVTTYRRLAEEVLARLKPHLPMMGQPWTAEMPLPGGDLPGGDFDRFFSALQAQYPKFDQRFLRRLARRHGTLTADVIGDAAEMSDMGRDFGAGLTEREVDYFKRREWARSADDVLWRRTKAGLHLAPHEREAIAHAIQAML
jgi:glycerol-3-phosphate dehydrogenase